MRTTALCLLCTTVGAGPVVWQVPTDNSNFWAIHRDVERGFRISYPPNWVVVPPKGSTVRFSVNPPDGPGNCNVAVRPNSELAGMTRDALNRAIQALPDDATSWAGYAGIPASQIVLIESRRARILNVPALVSTMETSLENLEGKFTRKQMVALTLTAGFTWSLNCGASSFKAGEARARFAVLQPTFNKVFGSFGFLK